MSGHTNAVWIVKFCQCYLIAVQFHFKRQVILSGDLDIFSLNIRCCPIYYGYGITFALTHYFSVGAIIYLMCKIIWRIYIKSGKKVGLKR
jgi:hypothetical protein